MTWLALAFFVFLLTYLGFFVALLYSMKTEAPFVPTGSRDVKKILEIAELKRGEVFYDLGSGDGRVVRAAARRGVHAVGFEQSWVLTWWARVLWRVVRPVLPAGGSASFIRGNYLKKDLGAADAIFCYLMPKAMLHLKEKFERELKPGTRILSRAFKLPGWTPSARIQYRAHGPPIYVYKKA